MKGQVKTQKLSSKMGTFWFKIAKPEYEHFCEYGSPNKNYLHRENGPAAVYANGTIQYWIHGNLHRDDGPAAVIPTCNITVNRWYKHGNLHRIGGPALYEEYTDSYYVNNKSTIGKIKDWFKYITQDLSVQNIPAEEWYEDGKLHRLDGPVKWHRGIDPIYAINDIVCKDEKDFIKKLTLYKRSVYKLRKIAVASKHIGKNIIKFCKNSMCFKFLVIVASIAGAYKGASIIYYFIKYLLL